MNILHNIAYFLGFTKTYHKQALYRLFDVCNEKYFEGKLPKIKILVKNDLGNILSQTNTIIHIGEANFKPITNDEWMMWVIPAKK